MGQHSVCDRYIDFISTENTTACEAQQYWLLIGTLLYKWCELLENKKKCQIHPFAVYWPSRGSYPWRPLMHQANLSAGDGPERPSGILNRWVYRDGLLPFSFSTSLFWGFHWDLYAACNKELKCSFQFQLEKLLHIVSNCWWSTDQLYNHKLSLWVQTSCISLLLFYQIVQHTSSFTLWKLFSLEIFFPPGRFWWGAMQSAMLL